MVENLIPVMEVPHQKAPELESHMKTMDSSERSFIVREVSGRVELLCSKITLDFVLMGVFHSGVSERAAKIFHGECFAVPELG